MNWGGAGSGREGFDETSPTLIDLPWHESVLTLNGMCPP